MNLKPLFNVLGALLTLLGITMVVPIFISYFTEGYDLFGFIYSSLICISIGTPIWFFTRHNKSLNNKVGFAVVTFSWIFAAIGSSLPFYLSGAIPNYTAVSYTHLTLPTKA